MTLPLALAFLSTILMIAYLFHARRAARRDNIQHKAAWQRLRERVSALEAVNSNRKREELRAERNGKGTGEKECHTASSEP